MEHAIRLQACARFQARKGYRLRARVVATVAGRMTCEMGARRQGRFQEQRQCRTQLHEQEPQCRCTTLRHRRRIEQRVAA